MAEIQDDPMLATLYMLQGKIGEFEGKPITVAAAAHKNLLGCSCFRHPFLKSLNLRISF